MLGSCKFCPLQAINTNADKVSYDLIIEAVLQIARNISAKYKADQTTSNGMKERLKIFQKSMEELNVTNQNLMKLVEKLEVSLKTEKEISELYKDQLSRTQSVMCQSDKAPVSTLPEHVTYTGNSHNDGSSTNSVVTIAVKSEAREYQDDSFATAHASPDSSTHYLQEVDDRSKQTDFINSSLPSSSYGYSSISNSYSCDDGLLNFSQNTSSASSNKYSHLLPPTTQNNSIEIDPKENSSHTLKEKSANDLVSLQKSSSNSNNLFINSRKVINKSCKQKYLPYHKEGIVSFLSHHELPTSNNTSSPFINTKNYCSEFMDLYKTPPSISDIANSIKYMSGPMVSYRFFKSSGSKVYRSVTKERFKEAVETLQPHYGTMLSTTIKGNEEAIVFIKRKPDEMNSEDVDWVKYTASYNKQVNYSSNNFGQGLLNFLKTEDLLPLVVGNISKACSSLDPSNIQKCITYS